MKMDAAEQAVKYALSELAVEAIKPDIDRTASILELESELVEMVALYRGQEVASEVERRFINASIT